MNPENGRTSVIVVAYNHKRFLKDCLASLERAAGHVARLILIDNASTDGSAAFIREELMSEGCNATKGGMAARYIESPTNLGFSGANNKGFEIALLDGDEFVYLLNPDTEAQPGFLEEAMKVMRSDPKIGIVQSLLLLSPETDKVNSWGNEIHFLGFGYAGGESVPVSQARKEGKLEVRDIAYASGAGMLVRTSLIREIGGLDEDLFAYHEDLEFSWRARLAGRRVLLAPASIVHHKYEFSRSIKKYFWMERNRFLVMKKLYKPATVWLIMPALLVMEAGLWLFAFRGGWWREKLRAYAYFFRPSTWRNIRRGRHHVRHLRKVSDRDASRLFTGKILFQQMNPTLLTRVANPLFSAYWTVARFFLRW